MNTSFPPLKTVILAGFISLAGCSSSSDNDPTGDDPGGDPGPGDTASTTFNFTVDLPDQFSARPAAYRLAQRVDPDNLQASDIEVAIVDAAGNVVEIITPISFEVEADGSYSLELPGGLRVDCVILIDVDGTATLTLNQPLPDNTLFAPTTAEEAFEIDIQSTVAYQEFLDSIPDTIDLQAQTDVTPEELQQIVETIQDIDLPSVQDGQTLEDYLVSVLDELDEVIEAQVQLASADTDVGFDLASYWVTDNGILYGFESDEGEFEIWAVQNNSAELIYEYDPAQAAFVLEGEYDDQDLYLADNGQWLTESTIFAMSPNNDGSVRLNFSAEENGARREDIRIDVAVDSSIILDGASIDQTVTAYDPGFADIIDDAAVFSAGARLLKIEITNLDDVYYLWVWDDGQSNQVANVYGTQGQPVDLDAMIVANPGSGTDPFNRTLFYVEDTLVELVAGGAANFFIESDGGSSISPIAGGSWTRETINGADIITLTIEEGFVELLDLDDEESAIIFAEYQGAVAMGSKIDAGSVTDGLLINEQAKMDIFANTIALPGPTMGTLYLAYEADSSENCTTGPGWQIETLEFTGSTYSLALCDGTIENGTYEELSNGDFRISYNGGADQEFIRFIGFDDNPDAFRLCWDDSQAGLDACANNPSDQGYAFSSLSAAEDFVDQQDSGGLQAALSGQYFFDGTERGMLVFHPDGFYVHWQDGTSDPNCAENNPGGGVEYGSYSYDGSTFFAFQEYDENASCGLTDFSSEGESLTVAANGDLVFDIAGEGEVIGARMDGGSDSIVGAWTSPGTVTSATGLGAFVFFPNGNYIIWTQPDNDNGNDCPNGGVEYGTYDLFGGILSGNVEFDDNGNCGVADGIGPITFPQGSSTTVTGDTLTIFDTEGSVSFTRL